MIPPQYQYEIASGYNQATLTNIEAIKPPGGTYFYPPSAYSAFNPGTVRIRVDGQIYNTGFPSATWHFDTMFRDQYQYLMQNYSTGGNSYSGTVTVQTRAVNGSYVPYNAVMVLPTLPEMERNFISFRNVSVKFTRLQAIS